MDHRKEQKGAKKGAIGLPLLIAIGVVTLSVGLSINLVSFNENRVFSNIPDSYAALAYAESGAKNALLRIAQDYTVTTTADSDCGSLSTDCYTIDFTTNGTGCGSNNNGCARVKIAGTSPTKTITAEGRVGDFIRKVQVTVTLSDNTSYLNMIKSTVWEEI